MAGKEKRGVAEADADLFRGPHLRADARMIRRSSRRPRRAEFVDWIERIGAVPVILSPAEHDRVVAFTSHLPQLLSTALAAMVAESRGPIICERVDRAWPT